MLGLLLLACTDSAPLTLRLDVAVDGQPVEISDDTPFSSAAGNAYGVRRFRAFLSELVLLDDAGEQTPLVDAWYVDLEDPDTLSFTLDLPTSRDPWASLEGRIGLSPALNVDGAFLSPPESEMFWPESLGGGYHYMKFEGRTLTATGEESSFALHMGALDGVDYSVPVSLPLSEVMSMDGMFWLALQADLARWLVDPVTIDLDSLPNGGVMDVAEIQGWLQANGHDVLSLSEEQAP